MRKSVVDYGATIGLTALTSLTTLLVIALLARFLDEAQFKAYSEATRYLGLLVTLCALGLNFAFIRASRSEDGVHALLAAATARRMTWLSVGALAPAWLLGLGALHLGGVLSLDWLLPLTYLWVVSQTGFNLSNPFARHVGGVRAYAGLYVWAKIVPLFVAAGCAAAAGRYEVFFIVQGMLCIAYQHRLWRGVPRPSAADFDRALARRMLRFGNSRWLDNLLRLSFPVVLISATRWALGAEAAGTVAVIYLVAKSVEGLLQPLVVAIMMRTGHEDGTGRGLLVACIGAIAITVVVYVARPPLEVLFGWYLGDTYLGLVSEAWTVLLAAGSLIGLNYLKALNDNRFDVSPLMLVNLASLALIALGMAFCRDASDVAALIAALHVGRFVLYATVLATGVGRPQVGAGTHPAG